MKKLFILLFSIAFSAEMEVDGNLKVTGNIDASGQPINNVGVPLSMTDAINGNVLQDALRDGGVYEYKTIILRLNVENLYNNQSPSSFRIYKELESTDYIDSNFDLYISLLSSQGYELYNISSPFPMYNYFYGILYSFRKRINE